MLSRIFPKQIDNDYRGARFALWLLVLFLLLKTFASANGIGLNPLWTGREVLQGIEKVPLDAFSTEAASAALVLFAWWHFAALMFTLFALIAIIRYRALIPLIYLLMAIEKIGEQAIVEISPVVGMLGAGAPMPFIGIALLLIGFGLSLTTPRRIRGQP